MRRRVVELGLGKGPLGIWSNYALVLLAFLYRPNTYVLERARPTALIDLPFRPVDPAEDSDFTLSKTQYFGPFLCHAWHDKDATCRVPYHPQVPGPPLIDPSNSDVTQPP